MFKECVFRTCSSKMASSDDVGKKISQLHQELVNAYKKRFVCENGQVAAVKCSPIWKNMRKDLKTFPELKSQVHSQIEAWKQEPKSASAGKGTLLPLWRTVQGKVSEFQIRLIPVTNILIELSSLCFELM